MSWAIGGDFVHLPEKENTPLLFSCRGGADPIQSPRVATVSRVLVTEGQTVGAGAETFVLRSGRARASSQLRTLTRFAHAGVTLAKRLKRTAAEANIKNAQVSQAESGYDFARSKPPVSTDLLNRLEKLSKSGGFSQIDCSNLARAAGSEKDQAVAQRTFEQVRLERPTGKPETRANAREQSGEVEKLKMKLGALKGDLENSPADLLTIRAPLRRRRSFLSRRPCRKRCATATGACQLDRDGGETARAFDVNESGWRR